MISWLLTSGVPSIFLRVSSRHSSSICHPGLMLPSFAKMSLPEMRRSGCTSAKRDMGRWNGLVGAHPVLPDPTVHAWLPLSFLRWLSHPIFFLLTLRQDPPPFPGMDPAFGRFMLIYIPRRQHNVACCLHLVSMQTLISFITGGVCHLSDGLALNATTTCTLTTHVLWHPTRKAVALFPKEGMKCRCLWFIECQNLDDYDTQARKYI
jgi:hypothetical protein